MRDLRSLRRRLDALAQSADGPRRLDYGPTRAKLNAIAGWALSTPPEAFGCEGEYHMAFNAAFPPIPDSPARRKRLLQLRALSSLGPSPATSAGGTADIADDGSPR
jgi:hypothetical protein